MKILVIGASGMIGNAVLRVLAEHDGFDVWGTVRDASVKHCFTSEIASRLIEDVSVECPQNFAKILDDICPNVVVNCAGLTKHKSQVDDPLISIPINTLMPHWLARLCKLIGARLIHVSTDCVFSGQKGNYVETDVTDAYDVYGKSKALGELFYPHTVTLRTSTIGHELRTKYGLLDWFLSQESSCNGFAKAIFSGLPTVVFAQIIRDIVIEHEELSGLYHVAAKPISKLKLLQLIAGVYGKSIEIVPNDKLIIDRSLNSDYFRTATGFIAPDWEEMIQLMHAYK